MTTPPISRPDLAGGSVAVPTVGVLATILAAMKQLWGCGVAFLLPLLVPMLTFVAVWALSTGMPEETPAAIEYLFLVLQFVLFTLFCVTCLRMLLLGINSVPAIGVTRWGRRESHMLLLLMSLYFVHTLTAVVLTTLLGVGAAQFMLLDVESLRWLFYVSLIPATYVLVRLSLLLPAWATDRYLTPRQVWLATRHNGWRMVLVLGGFPWALVVIRDQWLPADVGFEVYAGFGLIGMLLMVLEFAALVVCYRTILNTDSQVATADSDTGA